MLTDQNLANLENNNAGSKEGYEDEGSDGGQAAKYRLAKSKPFAYISSK